MAPPDETYTICMHPRLLRLRSKHWEQMFFSQYEVLDLINCLITPMFFANMLSRWPKSFVTMIYCIVLTLKGYQLTLLLIPAARQRRAHAKARYWLLLAERLLRQWIATPALGRGPRFIQFLSDSAAADPGFGTAVKLTMLTSGITHASWSAFCLPLDFTSQVVLNTVFFCINVTSALCQTAYAVAMLIRARPQLVWLQWGIEHVAQSLFRPVIWLTAALSSLDTFLGSFPRIPGADSAFFGAQSASHTCDPAAAAAAAGAAAVTAAAAAGGECLSPAALVAQPPGYAPDVDTLAGRLVLGSSMALLLFAVLYMPLLWAWRLECHFKTRFICEMVQRSRIASRANAAVKAAEQYPAGSSSSSRGPSQGMQCGVPEAQCSKAADAAPSREGSCTFPCVQYVPYTAEHDQPGQQGVNSIGCVGDASEKPTGHPAAFPLFPKSTWALVRHTVASAALCALLGQVFVWLCVVSPAVKGILWEQIPRPAIA